MKTTTKRQSIAVFAAGLTAALALAGCGGGSNTGTQQNVGSGQQPAAGQANGQMNGQADGQAAGQGDGAMNGGVSGGGDAGTPVPQMTGKKVGDDDEMTGEKIPQGMSLARAKAAGLGTDNAPVISVTATDTGCIPDKSTVAAGKVWFKLTNQGQRINELYLESTKGNELVEVEKIRKGQSGAFGTQVKPGNYLLACAPGMGDTQIRTPLKVTGGM